MEYVIYDFLVDSDLTLPCLPMNSTTIYPPARSRLTIRREESDLGEFPSITLAGGKHGRDLRAYDVGDGILVRIGGDLTVWASRNGDQLSLSFEAPTFDNIESFEDAVTATVNRSLASAVVSNLGVSICTLARGDIPFHGAAIEWGGSFIGLVAASGTGKSTLLWWLLNQGARFATDDVFIVRLDNGYAEAVPSVSLHAKVSKAALEERGENCLRYDEVIPGMDEFWIPIPLNQRTVASQPLHAVITLQPVRDPHFEGVRVSRVFGGLALAILMKHTQCLWASHPYANKQRALQHYIGITQSVPVFVIEYFRKFTNLPAMADAVYSIATNKYGDITKI